ncbi:MAG: KH domain-containing protein [Alphaproteobacteria bacterium]|nr:KH domain-containing protein [Alphaproteobacteria bacterium]
MRPALDAVTQQESAVEADNNDVLGVRELVEAIVKAMVDHPDQVRCREVQGTHSCVLELEVAKEDIGKVIGRKGIHADAIRRIVHAAGGKQKMRYVLEIIEDR